jgi:hypothetical protein
VQLARYRSDKPGLEDREWSQVREAQRQAALRGPGIFVVPALDLPLDDTIHLGTAGNLTLGARLARCALEAVYGSGRSADTGHSKGGGLSGSEWKAPDLIECALEDGQVVRLRFAPVRSRLESLDPKAAPYHVEDADGPMVIDKILYFHRDSVKLFLAKAPRGVVKVSCGYGENPDTLPLDVERQMPVLAFHAVPAQA